MAISGKSSAVTTAFTPGRASALLVSIETIRACACGERRILPHSMPDARVSAANTARPVTLSTPSGTDGTRANDFQARIDVIHQRVSPRSSAAASITARMILS